MKQIFNTNTNNLNTDVALLLGRIAIAALMLVHGLPKMEALFSGNPVQFPSVMGLSPEISLSLAVFSEVVCSILILTGFATRAATLPLIITMLIAIFSVHAADAFAKKELAVIYLVVYLVLLFGGSGKFSFDQLLQPRPVANYHPEIKPEDPTRYIYQ